MKKFLIAALIAALLLCCTALANSVPAYMPDYISYGDSGDPLNYLQELLGVDENDPVYREPIFGDETYQALAQFQYEYDLAATCEFDAETLYTLLGFDLRDLANDFLVWIPMHGGARYHSIPSCSSMIYPQQMPEACAYYLGFSACGTCFDEIYY